MCVRKRLFVCLLLDHHSSIMHTCLRRVYSDAHGDCLLLSPLAPCSCMSYHHDSRRIFIGQDNGAVVVSEANSNRWRHILAPGSLFWLFKQQRTCISGLNFNIWTPPNACGAGQLFGFKCVLVCVCWLGFQEFLISEDFNKMNHVKTYPGENGR